MENILNILYFVMLLLSYGLFLHLLLKSNFEKLFKKGQIGEIRIAYFVTAFLLSSIFSISVVKIVEVIYFLILK